MDFNPELVNALIRRRRSIFPKMYNDRPIPKAIIAEILENANWAPTHKLTEPWRFKVFRGEALQRLGAYLADYYKTHTPEARFQPAKYEKNRVKPTQCGCVIALCLHRDEKARVPEWEELAALACAVQNMWLSCTAYGIGAYWSSPAAALNGAEFFELAPGERCYGLFYMGYHDGIELPGKRRPISEKVVWVEE
ncbi:MAG: nitroreductase [Bacteroidetes bacterium]|nr:MAG: nitroreductase [Bacteroidota bacterium]